MESCAARSRQNCSSRWPAAASPRQNRQTVELIGVHERGVRRSATEPEGAEHRLHAGGRPVQRGQRIDPLRRLGGPAQVPEVARTGRRHVHPLRLRRGESMHGVEQGFAMGDRDAVERTEKQNPLRHLRRPGVEPRQERGDTRIVAGGLEQVPPRDRDAFAGRIQRDHPAGPEPLRRGVARHVGQRGQVLDRAADTASRAGRPARTPAGPAAPARECPPGGRSGTGRRPGCTTRRRSRGSTAPRARRPRSARSRASCFG